MQLQTLKNLGSVGSGGGGIGEIGPTGPTGPIGPSGIDAPERGGIIAFAYFPNIIWAHSGTKKQYAFKTLAIGSIIVSLDTPAIGSNIEISINRNGSLLYSFSIPQNTEFLRFSDLDLSIENNDYLTIDINSVGSSFPGKNLSIQFIT